MTSMCERAGIDGSRPTTFSATAASRLYHNGVDEQLIMERTGQWSIEVIRSYKRTSKEQYLSVSTSPAHYLQKNTKQKSGCSTTSALHRSNNQHQQLL